jgi:hypothetical protein
VLPASDLKEQFGPEPDLDEVYEHVARTTQQTRRQAEHEQARSAEAARRAATRGE